MINGTPGMASNGVVPDLALDDLTPWDGSVFSQETGYVDESPADVVIPAVVSGDPVRSIVSQASRFLQDAQALMKETVFLPHLMTGTAVAAADLPSVVVIAAIGEGLKLVGGGEEYPEIIQAETDKPASQGVALTTGLRMSHKLSQMLELSQSIQLLQTLSLVQKHGTVEDHYALIFDNARKLHVKINELGLDFEVALISRYDLPEIMHMGSAGMMAFGYAFVVEDFSADLDERTRERFIQLVAVHEYGEVIFGDHHKASLLELAVARHMGILEPYLEFLEQRYALKFRDVALHRLRKPLIKGLKRAGFKIDKKSEEPTEDWKPSLETDPEVVNATRIIERYGVSRDVRARFQAAVRDDKKMTDEELAEWVGYITALEQTRAFHQRALQDVDNALGESDHSLALRLAVFRSLGVLQHEMDEGVLDDRIEPELKERMGRELIANVREIIENSPVRAELLQDPFFDMSPEQLTELAKLDHKIYDGMDLTLLLVPPKRKRNIEDGDKRIEDVKREQAQIEDMRREAWGRALEGGLDPKAHQASLEAYVETVKFYSDSIKHYLEYGVLTKLQEGRRSSDRDALYFDAADLQAQVTARIYDAAHPRLSGFEGDKALMDRFVNEAVAKAIPAIWEARRGEIYSRTRRFNKNDPQLAAEFGKPAIQLPEPVEGHLENISGDARVRYLKGMFDKTKGASREALLKIVAGIIYGVSPQELYKAGMISEELTVGLLRYKLGDGLISMRDLFSDIGLFPHHLANVGWDLEELFRAYRAAFHRTIFGVMEPIRPELVLGTMKGNKG